MIRDHLRSNMGIVCGPRLFAVQDGNHLQSGIICGHVQRTALIFNYCCFISTFPDQSEIPLTKK